MQTQNPIFADPKRAVCSMSAAAAPAVVSEPAAVAPAVALHDVAKLFGTFAAVRHLSFELAAGTSTVILGPNGAGKSTLLRLLAGLTAPSRGRVLINGQEPTAQRGRIAYMSHAPMLYDELSALENLNYFATLHREEGCDCVASPEMALRAVNLDPRMTRPVSQYSQGMRQRASLARVLQTDPEVLLLDEPFSNLDVASAREMVALLADFVTWPRPARPGAADRRTVILTTHQAHLAEPIADCTLTIEQGTLTSLIHREPARREPVR